MTINDTPKKRLKAQRWSGLFLTLMGAAIGYFVIVCPLQDALHHVASLSLHPTWAGATLMILSYGLMQLLFPGFSVHHMGGFRSRMPKTKMGWAFFVATIAIGFLFSIWFEAFIKSMGYDV